MEEAVRKYLDKFGNHFIVASMVPALSFSIILIIFIDPFLPILSSILQSDRTLFDIVSLTLILLIPTIILGFSLSVLNLYLFKIFEGYSIFWHFSPLLRKQQKKAIKLANKIDKLSRSIERLENRPKSKRAKKELPILRKKYYYLAATYDQTFPPNFDEILPTNFGNTLRASESYSLTRYGIQSTVFWPRLIQVIPDRYQSYIDQSRNEVSFLMNLTILFFLLSIFCIFGFISQFLPNTLENFFYESNIIKNPNTYLIYFLLCNLLAFFFHRAANVVISSFGNMIRSAYDLFRQDLLTQLKLKIPRNSHEEFYLWKKLGEFIVLGPKSRDFDILYYDLEDH